MKSWLYTSNFNTFQFLLPPNTCYVGRGIIVANRFIYLFLVSDLTNLLNKLEKKILSVGLRKSPELYQLDHDDFLQSDSGGPGVRVGPILMSFNFWLTVPQIHNYSYLPVIFVLGSLTWEISSINIILQNLRNKIYLGIGT